MENFVAYSDVILKLIKILQPFLIISTVRIKLLFYITTYAIHQYIIKLNFILNIELRFLIKIISTTFCSIQFAFCEVNLLALQHLAMNERYRNSLQDNGRRKAKYVSS